MKFKPEKIMKFSTSMRKFREVTKSLKIDINGPTIEVKKEDCTVVDAKNIIPFLQIFYIYTQILFFLAVSGNKLHLELVLDKYAKYLMML